MSVIVMAVKRVEKHPNADSLMRYEMSAPFHEQLQIIANQDRIYNVGDRVAVALVGATLKDGTKISATKLRGLASYGMALGVVEAAVGTDLSLTYCQPVLTESVPLVRWPSIELLHSLRRNLATIAATPKITYRAKVKLDGTNAAVQVFPDGQVAAQSRAQVITPKSDNLGFAQWLRGCQSVFAAVAQPEHMTIFGEWCGKGIQKRTSISQIDRKIFVVFAIQFGGVEGQVARLEINPDRIATYLPNHPDVYVLPFYQEPIDLDFGNEASLKEAITCLNRQVEAVEQVDPWVKETFGIEGLGEGLVFYPDVSDRVDRLDYAELMFKAKGAKHQVVKIKQPVQLDPERVKTIDEFVTLFVMPNRLAQALTEGCDGQLEMAKIGCFLKWISVDIQKESVAELEAANLTWKEVNKAVTQAAKDWYLAQVKAA